MKPTFQGEVMLAGWKESHTSGAVVSFWLPDADALDVFRGLTAKKGNTAGQRFMAVLVEVNDDETPKEPEPVQPAHRQLGPLALLACQWCRDAQFQAWAGHNWPHADDSGPLTEEQCRMLVLDICKIGSRRELDTVPAAAAKFLQEFRLPYMGYLRGVNG